MFIIYFYNYNIILNINTSIIIKIIIIYKAYNNATLQIDYIKDNIENYKLKGCKKYIETKDIIQEDSNEYIKTLKTNQNKRNSLSSINNTKLVKKNEYYKFKK